MDNSFRLRNHFRTFFCIVEAYGVRRDVIRRPPNAPTPNGVPANRGEP
jgi:hypothetical protein